MFQRLQEIHRRPEPFAHPGAKDLWTDEHVSSRMLACHLDPDAELSSRRHAFIDRSARWMVEHFDLRAGRRVADFGCGPGLYTTRLAASGADVIGIDFSERSIRYARSLAMREGVRVEHVHADYLTFETDERFDLITMIMCDFCVLGPKQRQGLLERWREFLRPGGAVLFDVYSIPAFEARHESSTCAPNLMDGFWSSAPYFGFQSTFTYPDEKVVLDKYTIVEEDRTRVIHNWLQYYAPEALERELGRAGFDVDRLLGDVAGGPFDATQPEYAVLARPCAG